MPAARTPRSPSTSSGRRWLRRMLLGVFILLLGVVVLLGTAWWWSGQSQSLQRTLEYVERWLPADQKLEARGVQGTLRNGGQIDWLRWSSPTMQVEVTKADIGWQLPPLLSRTVHFGQVNMEQLRIQSTPGPKDETPTEPLQSLELPVRIDLPVHIEQLIWEGPPQIEIHALDALYRYTGKEHQLDVRSLRYADGSYEAQLRLQGAAPMQLQASLQGHLQTTLPGKAEQALKVEAQAKIQGTLATEAARLQITAQANTTTVSTSTEGEQHSDAAQAASTADISATIAPWSAQVLEQADATLQHINIAWFLPDGPQTDLSGSLQAGPKDNGWALQASVDNPLAGPWDQQALPVRNLTAQAQFDGQQQWTLEQARIDLGPKGPAHVQAQGQFNTDSQVFEGQVEIVEVDPALLYSTLDSAPLSGSLQAHSDTSQQVQFKLDLKAPDARQRGALHLGAARAEGSWQAPELQVRQLYLQALQTTLQSPSVRFNTDTQHIEGKLQAQLPGAQADLELNTSPTEGQGQLQLNIQAVQTLTQWLEQLPGMHDLLGGASLQGHAQAKLQWTGGWGKLQQRLQNPTAAREASQMLLNAQLLVPQLSYQSADGSTSSLADFKLTLDGSPESLQTELSAQAKVGNESLRLQTTAVLGLQQAVKAHPLDWYARINQLQAQWQTPSDATPWKAQLAEPLSIEQRTTGNPTQTTSIETSAGKLTVQPPAHAGEAAAYAVWEPVLLRQSAQGNWAIRSKGSLHDLPMMWADVLNPDHPPLAAIGISGDLLFKGEWDVDTTGGKLRAHALVERASGDIRFTAEDSNAANVTIIRSSGASEQRSPNSTQVQSRAFTAGRGVRARVQEMRVLFDANDKDVRAQLHWSTERAGQIHADIRSKVQTTSAGIVWPDSAPLSGTIDAALPNLGVWAFFAPPGWRVSGSLMADLDLFGTRKAPDWRGKIEADKLSVQSLLDGVDLKDGYLRATLQGSRINITDIYLQGGEGSSTRITGQSGNLTKAPKSGGTLKGSGVIEYDPLAPEGSSGLRMDLRAVADHLQVLVRADRQLSVSGDLKALLEQGQFTLDGKLTIDRAAIILASDSAPSLGDDVHITSAATRKAAAEKAAREAAQARGSVQVSKPPILHVQLNLGDDFALQGYGITTRLKGELSISGGPRITGEIHTVNGRYRAWGQLMDVEKGTIRFNGPYDNPALDIVAIRPNIDVRAGVKVTGSANNPRITLFSDPEMSDAEKLSWIVMGRGASGGGAESALLQQAALAMLSGGGSGGNFASQLGFDEIGFSGPSEDGERGAALTVGKRLSKDLYVAYEQSLNGAMGTLFIFYDLSRRLTLRAQTGENSAVDLIYTRVKD